MIKYIFSISAGRSGSGYLARMLQKCEGIAAYHEPEPVMNGKEMFEYLGGNRNPLKSLMDAKLDSIQRLKGDEPVYVETNHCFIKGFGWLLAERISQEEIGLIYLNRDKAEIVRSLYEIGCSPLTKIGRQYIMTPLVKNPIKRLPFYEIYRYKLFSYLMGLLSEISEQNSNKLYTPTLIRNYELDLLDWYVDEVKGLAQKFMERYPQIRVYNTSIYNLNNKDEFKRMFDYFNLKFNPESTFHEQMGKLVNTKASLKKLNKRIFQY